ncbi:hypothetical protein JRQ81_014210 [Phrynocephalus forsythii]|uniref:Uncharacterized protein n=1 Tax=Phrynocephalus forsythii TaxID=171643 RepID=A0A9Q0XXA7_9SAUR|nr:hypothetical protein JRQ81_014210 [Phrynocephalus forsythii]
MQRLVAWDQACLPLQPPAFKSMEVANFYYEADCLTALSKLNPRAAPGAPRSMTELTVGDHERAIDFSPYLDSVASQPHHQHPHHHQQQQQQQPPAAGGNFEPVCNSGGSGGNSGGQDFLSDLLSEQDYKGGGGEKKHPDYPYISLARPHPHPHHPHHPHAGLVQSQKAGPLLGCFPPQMVETKVEPVFEHLDSCKGPHKEDGGGGGGARPGLGGMSSPYGSTARSYLGYQSVPSGSSGNLSTSSSSSPPGTPNPSDSSKSASAGGGSGGGGGGGIVYAAGPGGQQQRRRRRRQEQVQEVRGQAQRRVQDPPRAQQHRRAQEPRQSQNAQPRDAAQSPRADGRERETPKESRPALPRAQHPQELVQTAARAPLGLLGPLLALSPGGHLDDAGTRAGVVWAGRSPAMGRGGVGGMQREKGVRHFPPFYFSKIRGGGRQERALRVCLDIYYII